MVAGNGAGHDGRAWGESVSNMHINTPQQIAQRLRVLRGTVTPFVPMNGVQQVIPVGNSDLLLLLEAARLLDHMGSMEDDGK